jgi:hypothetical protein
VSVIATHKTRPHRVASRPAYLCRAYLFALALPTRLRNPASPGPPGRSVWVWGCRWLWRSMVSRASSRHPRSTRRTRAKGVMIATTPPSRAGRFTRCPKATQGPATRKRSRRSRSHRSGPAGVHRPTTGGITQHRPSRHPRTPTHRCVISVARSTGHGSPCPPAAPPSPRWACRGLQSVRVAQGWEAPRGGARWCRWCGDVLVPPEPVSHYTRCGGPGSPRGLSPSPRGGSRSVAHVGGAEGDGGLRWVPGAQAVQRDGVGVPRAHRSGSSAGP